MVFPGDAGVPTGLIPTRYNDVAPRLGVAYDPLGDGKTAIRAGYGIFYSVGFAGLYNSNYGQPFQPSVNITETPSLVNPLAGISAPFPPAAGVYQFVPRQLMQNLSLTAAYVGNVSRHLQLNRDANAPVYIPGKSTSANVNSRRLIETGILGPIYQAETAANASYNSLQVSLNRRFARGVTVLANYTYSKSIDMQSADQQAISTVTFVDSNNLRLDRGPSSFDVRHVFNLTFIWQLPKFTRWGVAGREILGDWQVNGLARYASGLPITVTSGVDTNLDGNNNDRPNLIADPALPTNRTRAALVARYFNPAAYQTAATGFDGTAGRGLVTGPGLVNWDFSLFRTFPIHENHRVQFRAEFFNLFNRPNFNLPVTVLSNPNVGTILSAGAGRVVQFGLKYVF
jgi:hypothetical protein